jgi:hypothetical protein
MCSKCFAPSEFCVPASIADFAILGDNPERDMEWGMPPPLRITKQATFYDAKYAKNVLQCIFEVADAQHGGSDCNAQAGWIKYWVRQQRKKIGITVQV